jgi:hypothetical protein
MSQPFDPHAIGYAVRHPERLIDPDDVTVEISVNERIYVGTLLSECNEALTKWGHGGAYADYRSLHAKLAAWLNGRKV